MKKLIYSLAFIALGLVGCTNFDDAVTENYGDGPAISINITATTDSAFTFTLTPAEGTQFYNFIIDENDEAEELDASALLQGQYGNDGNVRKAADAPTTTLTIDAEPNTTYQIYAVAASDKGIVGEVAVASVTTTDANAPALVKNAFEPVPEKKSVIVSFDQKLIRGEGAVTGIYYKEWDWDNPVTIDPEDITVEIDGKDAILSAPETPDGAIVLFSWAAGAFVDAFGNKCGAFTTTYDEAKDDFIGAAVQNKKVAFEITDDLFADTKTAFKKPAEFQGVATFEFDIFRIDEGKTAVKDGDVSVTYTNDKKTTTIKLTPEQWSVDGKKLTFSLPAGIQDGDEVTLSIKEGVIYDVYGNPNAAFTSEDAWWKYVTMSVEDFIGTYNNIYISYFDESKTPASLGTVTIEEDKEGENALIIKDFYLKGSILKATYDLATKTIYVNDSQELGVIEDEDGKFGLMFVNAAADAPVAFKIDVENGTLTLAGMWGVLLYDEAFTDKIGWYDAASASQLQKAVAEEEPASESRMAKINLQPNKVAKTVNLKKFRK